MPLMLAIFLFAALLAVARCANGPILSLSSGPVQGEVLPNGVQVFKGIPYAQPPTGTRRWAAPQPVVPWSQIRSAVAFSPACPQLDVLPSIPAFSFAEPNQSEDCLYLNIWLPPNYNASSALPILVFVHGGSFIAGSGAQYQYHGVELALTQNVVVVTINYRLGPFGFLAHPAFVAESPRLNYGLLDQQLALSFVAKNAARFGGARQNITLIGESAGAMSVCLHLVMPGSYGLFARAVLESGPCLQVNLFMNTQRASTFGNRLAEALNCGPMASAACLRQASMAAVLRALPLYNASKIAGVEWNPIIDGVSVPALPRALFYAGKYQVDVDLMAGMCKDGGSLFTDWSLDFFSYGQLMLDGFGPYATIVESTYAPITYNSPIYANSWSDMLTDVFFLCPTQELFHIYNAQRRARAYAFVSDHRPAWASDTSFPVKYWGAYHTSDMPLVFGRAPAANVSLNAAETQLAAVVMQYVGNFARSGSPVAPGVANWPQYTSNSMQSMVWSTTQLGPISNYHGARCDFWRGFSDTVCAAMPCKCDGSCAGAGI